MSRFSGEYEVSETKKYSLPLFDNIITLRFDLDVYDEYIDGALFYHEEEIDICSIEVVYEQTGELCEHLLDVYTIDELVKILKAKCRNWEEIK